MRFSTALVAALPLVAASPLTKRAPLHIRDDADLIPGKYIVKMKGGSHLSSAGGLKGAIEKLMSAPEQLFEGFGAFAGSLDDTEVESLRDNPDVEYIEQDARAKIFATQQNATWGPARISHKEPGADTYEYDDAAGEGTCIYIVDTGIDVDHPVGPALMSTDITSCVVHH